MCHRAARSNNAATDDGGALYSIAQTPEDAAGSKGTRVDVMMAAVTWSGGPDAQGQLVSRASNPVRGIRGALLGAPLGAVSEGLSELESGLLAPAWHKWEFITTTKGLAGQTLLVSDRQTYSNRMEETVKYLGIDVHVKASVWCLLDETGKVVERGKVATTAPDLTALLKRLIQDS